MPDVTVTEEGQVQTAMRRPSMPIRVAVIKARPKGQCMSARTWGKQAPVHLLEGMRAWPPAPGKETQ